MRRGGVRELTPASHGSFLYVSFGAAGGSHDARARRVAVAVAAKLERDPSLVREGRHSRFMVLFGS